MKKKLILACLLVSMLFLLCSCGDKATEGLEYEQQDGTYIVTGYHGTDVDVVIPDTYNDVPVTVIGESCFEDSDIQSIQVGNNVEIIEDYAFRYASLLKEVSLPASLCEIGDSCFNDCVSLKTVSFGRNCKLETIDNMAFDGCESLRNIKLPDQLSYIGIHAFSNCTSLNSLEIPASVSFVGRSAFLGFTAEQKIIIHGSTDGWQNASRTSAWDGESVTVDFTWHGGCDAKFIYK